VLPIEFIRRHPEEVRRAGALKGEEAPVDEVLAVDAEWRERLQVAESARAQQNQLSRRFSETRDPDYLRDVKEIGEEAKRELARASDLKLQLDELLLRVPNVFHESVPIGETEADNVVVREWGRRPEFDFEPRPHYDIGEALGIMDFERAARVAGSRFAFLKGAGARLERALVQFMLDLHTNEQGYTEVYAPFLVNSASMLGTAQLPKFAADAFRVEGRDLWLIPTAEVPLTSMARDEILDEGAFPWRLMAHTSCFRREAGSAGRDTRGLLRVHEFDKVEILAYCTPEQAPEVHADLLDRAEGALADLGLAYRVVDLCAGDLGASSARTFDLEVYAPGCDQWLEASSVSWFTDYQARRANVRYRLAAGGSPRFVHTLNGSALAVPRVWAALVETYRRPDGSVELPDVLWPYLRGAKEISAEPAR
jgi:seryl-tRNA synthetase